MLCWSTGRVHRGLTSRDDNADHATFSHWQCNCEPQYDAAGKVLFDHPFAFSHSLCLSRLPHFLLPDHSSAMPYSAFLHKDHKWLCQYFMHGNLQPSFISQKKKAWWLMSIDFEQTKKKGDDSSDESGCYVKPLKNGATTASLVASLSSSMNCRAVRWWWCVCGIIRKDHTLILITCYESVVPSVLLSRTLIKKEGRLFW